MRFLCCLALAAFATVLQAQPASYRFPFTYFYRGWVNAVGPGGDIWTVGVSSGPGSSVNDPDGNPPPSGDCFTFEAPNDPFRFPRIGPCTDLVAMRLAGDGSGVIFSKYLGGPGADFITDIALDAEGRAYLTGTRAVSPLPFNQPRETPYLVALEPNGAELFDIELPAGFVPRALALDGRGGVHIGGLAKSIGGQTLTSPKNMIVTVDAAAREIVASATLGGRGDFGIWDIAAAEDGTAYAVGYTQSSDYPFTNVYTPRIPRQYPTRQTDYDIFVAALTPDGEWAWVASMGGLGDEKLPRIALKPNGELLIAAETDSEDLPERDWTVPTPGGRLWTATLEAATGAWLRGGRLGYYADAFLDDLTRDSDGTVYLAGHGTPLGETLATGFVARLDAAGAFAERAHVGYDRTNVTACDGRVIVGGTSAGPGATSYRGLSGRGGTFLAPLEFGAPTKIPHLDAILNAAGTLAAPLSPGAVVSLYGDQLGPLKAVAAIPSNGRFPKELAGVQVLVGGRAIPLLFVSQGQINAVLPFDLGDDLFVEAKVTYNGQTSNLFQMPKTESAPEIFNAVINADGTLNSPQNPAARGSTVSVWLSGVGTFSPTREDGAIEGTTGSFPQIDAPVRVRLAGKDAVVTYAGAAPGLVAGIAQINFVIPETVQDGRNLSVWVGEGWSAETYRASMSVSP